MHIDALFSICYPTTGNSVSISIEDATSRCKIVEIEISHAEFTRALGSLQCRPCTGVFYEDSPVGKRLEVKTVCISMTIDEYHRIKRDDAAIADTLAQYEIDGWTGSVFYVKHSACYKDGWLKARFLRYVTPGHNTEETP